MKKVMIIILSILCVTLINTGCGTQFENKTHDEGFSMSTNNPIESKIIANKNDDVVEDQRIYIKGSIKNNIKMEILKSPLPVLNNEFIDISNEITNILASIAKHGYGDLIIKHQEKGIYLLVNPKKGEFSDDFDIDTAKVEEFLSLSTIYNLLNDNRLVYEVVSRGNEILIKIMHDDIYTNSFIRIDFDDMNTCGEIKINLFKSSTIKTLKALDFEEAIKNAFTLNQDTDFANDELLISSNPELIYLEDGYPYYKCYATIPGTRLKIEIFALAVAIEQ